MSDQSLTGIRFVLAMDGENLGYVKSLDGGYTKAELATHQLGPDNVQRKHITNVVYEPLTAKVGMGMSRGFYELIQQCFEGAHIGKNLEIHACDFDYKSRAVRELVGVHIVEVTIPALDGSSKEPAYMTVKLQLPSSEVEEV